MTASWLPTHYYTVHAIPKVLIIGATGYIGQALALSLMRSGGYPVYGLARSPEKAKSLEALEIIPVKGSVSDSTNYLNLIRSANIDIVVDAAGANMESKEILDNPLRVGAERLEVAHRAGALRRQNWGLFIRLAHGSMDPPLSLSTI
jgi:saccharopine dehydrogenase-like NADP-dependent oxidoreductase